MTVMQPMAQVVGQVCQTMDYSLFKTLKGNRDVNQAHLHRLTKSVAKQYLLSPIVVNERFEIIDGQHRFQAAKANNLPIYYIVAIGYSLNEVQILNSNSSNWRNVDYLKAYCDMGVEAYLKFRAYTKKWPEFKFNSIYAIVTLKQSYGNSANSKALKREGNKDGSYFTNYFAAGKLVIADAVKIEKTANQIIDFKPFYTNYTRSTFVYAMIGIFNLEHYDHERMINKLSLQPTALKDCTSVTQYRKLLTDIYNYKAQNKVSLEF